MCTKVLTFNTFHQSNINHLAKIFKESQKKHIMTVQVKL